MMQLIDFPDKSHPEKKANYCDVNAPPLLHSAGVA